VIGTHDTNADARRRRQLATAPDLRQMRDRIYLVSPKRIVRFVRRRHGFDYLGISPNQQSAAFARHIPPRMGRDCFEYCSADPHHIAGAWSA
jgi:hypothetical protein